MEPLRQRFQSLDALRAVEECRRSGRQQVELGEPPAVDVVDQLAQGIQPLLPHVAPHPLKRLDLVEDEDQARVARIFQDQQQPTQETQGGKVVHVTFDASHSLDRGSNMRLPASQPASPSAVAWSFARWAARYVRRAAANWGVARSRPAAVRVVRPNASPGPTGPWRSMLPSARTSSSRPKTSVI